MDNIFNSPKGFNDPNNPKGFDESTKFIPTEPLITQEMDLEYYTEDQLLDLLLVIYQKLPATKLKNLDLKQEAVVNYLLIRNLNTNIINNDEIAANQKAQVLNSLSSSLAQLERIQREAYSFERFKQIETLLADFMNEELDDEQKVAFYEKYVRKVGKQP